MIATELKRLVMAIRLDAGRPPADASSALDGSSLRYLPLAGLLSGLLFCSVYLVAAQLLPHSTAVVIALALSSAASGGAHEIGWARLCEELGSRRPWGQRVYLLGGSGTIALILMLVLRLEVLSLLDASWISVAIVSALPLSRAMAVAACASLARRRCSPGSASSGVSDEAPKDEINQAFHAPSGTTASAQPEAASDGSLSDLINAPDGTLADSSRQAAASATARPASRATHAAPEARAQEKAKDDMARLAHGMGAPQVRWRDAAISLALGAAPATAMALWFGQFDAFTSSLIPLLVTAVGMRQLIKRRLRVCTPHALQGLAQACEVAFLLGLLAWWTALDVSALGSDSASDTESDPDLE
jgi:cobalamin synthase